MHAALIHQGPGHDVIVGKMAGQEPVIRMDVLFCADDSQPKTASRGIKVLDPVDHFHLASRASKRLFFIQSFKVRAKAAG